MLTYPDFAAAEAAAGPEDMVCGTLMPTTHEPTYYVLPRGISDYEGMKFSFEVRNGRAMSELEEWAYSQAQALRAHQAAA